MARETDGGPGVVGVPLKWHGGKAYLAARIVALMPPRHTWCHYVEPYFGGGSVLLENDPEGISEVANDLNGALVNFWNALRDPERFEKLKRRLEATPFSEFDWIEANTMCEFRPADEDLWAWAFFVVCRQSLAGRMASFAPLSRSRTRRGMNEQASAWTAAVDGLPAVHARLRRVAVLNRPALDVIRRQDGGRTLFYLDPPYLHETRATTGEYAHEMTERQHAELLDVLAGLKGRFLLSGYRSPLYDGAAERHGWRRADFDLPNNAAGGAAKRRMTESVWMNYPAEG